MGTLRVGVTIGKNDVVGVSRRLLIMEICHCLPAVNRQLLAINLHEHEVIRIRTKNRRYYGQF